MIPKLSGTFEALSGMDFSGYEIHMGESSLTDKADVPAVIQKGNVLGTYVHGIFDAPGIAKTLCGVLAKNKGIQGEDEEAISYAEFKEKQYDMLADILREHLDMDYIYSLL